MIATIDRPEDEQDVLWISSTFDDLMAPAFGQDIAYWDRSIPLPQEAVLYEEQGILDYLRNSYAMEGQKISIRTDEEAAGLLNEIQTTAEYYVMRSILVGLIAEREGISVTQDDYDELCEKLARVNNASKEAVIAYYTETKLWRWTQEYPVAQVVLANAHLRYTDEIDEQNDTTVQISNMNDDMLRQALSTELYAGEDMEKPGVIGSANCNGLEFYVNQPLSEQLTIYVKNASESPALLGTNERFPLHFEFYREDLTGYESHTVDTFYMEPGESYAFQMAIDQEVLRDSQIIRINCFSFWDMEAGDFSEQDARLVMNVYCGTPSEMQNEADNANYQGTLSQDKLTLEAESFWNNFYTIHFQNGGYRVRIGDAQKFTCTIITDQEHYDITVPSIVVTEDSSQYLSLNPGKLAGTPRELVVNKIGQMGDQNESRDADDNPLTEWDAAIPLEKE